MNVSRMLDVGGMKLRVRWGCGRGSDWMGLGYMMMKEGLEEMVVCGGGEERNY